MHELPDKVVTVFWSLRNESVQHIVHRNVSWQTPQWTRVSVLELITNSFCFLSGKWYNQHGLLLEWSFVTVHFQLQKYLNVTTTQIFSLYQFVFAVL